MCRQSLSSSSSQLLEKPVLASKVEEGAQVPPSHGAPQLDSSPLQPAASQDAQRCAHGPQLGVSGKAFPPETDFKSRQKQGRGDAHVTKPIAFAVSSGHQQCPPLRAHSGEPSPLCFSPAPQGHRHAYSRLGPKDASTPRETSLLRETLRPVGRSSDNEEDFPSLAFLMGSPKNLLPCTLSLSPVSASGLGCSGGLGRRPAAQSQPQKRKRDQSVMWSWTKRHCPYYGAAARPSYCQLQTVWGCPDQM